MARKKKAGDNMANDTNSEGTGEDTNIAGSSGEDTTEGSSGEDTTESGETGADTIEGSTGEDTQSDNEQPEENSEGQDIISEESSEEESVEETTVSEPEEVKPIDEIGDRFLTKREEDEVNRRAAEARALERARIMLGGELPVYESTNEPDPEPEPVVEEEVVEDLLYMEFAQKVKGYQGDSREKAWEIACFNVNGMLPLFKMAPNMNVVASDLRAAMQSAINEADA